MRVVGEIPHHTFRITVHAYNGKFLIKIEWGQYEQCFKVAETDLSAGLEDIRKMLTDEFLVSCMQRFRLMHEDFLKVYQSTQQ